MKLRWTAKALSDLERLHAFLAPVDPHAAARIVRALVAAPEHLLSHPRLGRRLGEFDSREVRRIFVGDYEMRYEISGSLIIILRLWHAREDR